MPNGGMMPCCLVCNWADEKDTGIPPKVFCKKHAVRIHNAMTLFCSDLSLYYDEHPPAEKEGFLDGMIYMWPIVAYIDPKYSALPQYYHKPVSLISISEYREWDEEMCHEAVRARDKEVGETFWKKFGKEN